MMWFRVSIKIGYRDLGTTLNFNFFEIPALLGILQTRNSTSNGAEKLGKKYKLFWIFCTGVARKKNENK